MATTTTKTTAKPKKKPSAAKKTGKKKVTLKSLTLPAYNLLYGLVAYGKWFGFTMATSPVTPPGGAVVCESGNTVATFGAYTVVVGDQFWYALNGKRWSGSGMNVNDYVVNPPNTLPVNMVEKVRCKFCTLQVPTGGFSSDDTYGIGKQTALLAGLNVIPPTPPPPGGGGGAQLDWNVYSIVERQGTANIAVGSVYSMSLDVNNPGITIEYWAFNPNYLEPATPGDGRLLTLARTGAVPTRPPALAAGIKLVAVAFATI